MATNPDVFNITALPTRKKTLMALIKERTPHAIKIGATLTHYNFAEERYTGATYDITLDEAWAKLKAADEVGKHGIVIEEAAYGKRTT
ncbi:hypothetical protein JCM19037_1587 [Geomicrobium sp. JCM 19037]|uniref:hypothetical protein n=1 Tax=Geomicrobium sp. JCM 19037 TaxID=1460634 RepID=UPI00045F3F06|nr:hypothetical protein [Geomicrobium sp. JCM 19037]GAK03276.1 hypothetical protein JCM19037_1587 [Geomicrobium sp. JCM 19037]